MIVRLETQQVLQCILFILYFIGQIASVRITSLRVPKEALEGDKIRLVCDYESEGGYPLYSFKWYKDGQEFYRQMPGISPHSTEERCKDLKMYKVKGVSVDCWDSSEREVVLVDTTSRTSGEYKCEIIGEYPTFRKEMKTSRLDVYEEPLIPPRIVGGGEDLYTPSEYVALNCTSPNQEYFPELSWLINGHPANQNFVQHYDQRTLGLFFQARSEFFQRGTMSVTCASQFGSNHMKATNKQLRSQNYLIAEGYQLNGGERREVSVKAAVVATGASLVLCLTSIVLV